MEGATKEILEKLNGLAKAHAKTDEKIDRLSAQTDAKFFEMNRQTDAKIEALGKRTDEKIAAFADEIKRHFGVVVENLDDQIKLIAEGHIDTNRRLDGIDNRLDGIDNRLDGIDNRLDGVDNRLDGIDNRLDIVEEKIDFISEKTVANSQDLEIVKKDLTFVKQDLRHKVSYDEFAALEKRVLALENRAQKERVIWHEAGVMLWLAQSDGKSESFFKKCQNQNYKWQINEKVQMTNVKIKYGNLILAFDIRI